VAPQPEAACAGRYHPAAMGRRLIPTKVLPARYRRAARAGDDYGVSDVPDWRDVDWAAHTHAVTIDRRRVTYVYIGEGAGPPVVFVHGLAGCWQNWMENLARVGRHRRAIALDLPGFGQSEMPRDPISITHYARTVDALCQVLGLGPVAVVGNSMGGFIAADLAARFPARVERLVLAGAAGISHTQLIRQTARTGARAAMLLATSTAAQHRVILARPRIRHLALSTIFRHPSRLELDVLLEQSPHFGGAGFHFGLDALMSYDVRDRLPEIACPTLVVQGLHDMLVPVADAEQYARLIPGARKVMWPETGHVPQLERPVRFNNVLLEFLEAGGRASRSRWRAA
jgi:pimeloyl-ACP methyl ester carboxylesterase